jgi:hypothetical protein
MTEMIFPYISTTTMYFELIFISLDSLNLGLSSDIKIIRDI